MEPRLRSVWPTESKFEKRAYNLLREAYIKARYSREYAISEDELAWLAERVAILQDLVRELGSARIAQLEESSSPSHIS
ncbi:hypothetical protein [Sphingobium sp. TCM1]|uniref:hypothetical protein n=1 Tax=Sphingobium sp. TCM1 TaxID=453246 RepID=UPI0007F55F95|nr:hypothetical protein [Sphingobium sp. TCM1]OAN54865.1 hypothetical protein A7Q26_22775 [Sphingobium sp. TCM1]